MKRLDGPHKRFNVGRPDTSLCAQCVTMIVRHLGRGENLDTSYVNAIFIRP